MARFAVELVYGDDEQARLAVRPAHREYLASLTERGVLLAAGPWADGTGALLVYEVADEAELRKVIDADPYTPAAVIAETRVHEWQALLGTWV
ncbi:YciI family protein [Saccharothrix coeruleofusca]|uniref:YCII-related domain-containing protein n=1 Tax=Saccharothrix coeruleofusca TaxID=33919 RepID=A0A918AST2_9PSEU|nr:YciI family protein [Saccharothrix coeruleofusca]MBP2339749.1 uncharacterized protein YciI [Saccharothrix coeruleofusca]GGP80433.1 hypothetical protein GCM10010185_62860 [Saccharothrix coeruleofusca]